MVLTLTLAAGLLAAPAPQAENGWAVEIKGYTYHREAAPKGWIIELRGFTEHEKQPEPQAKLHIEPIETQYYGELSAFWKQFEAQRQIDAVETIYVDDLPAFFKSLKQQQP